MTRGRQRLGLACLLLLLQGPADAAGRKVALVIGNATYRNVPALPNPAHDADLMAEMFRASGFDLVTAKRDLDSQELKREMRLFIHEASDADIAVVFFAGHGIEVGGINYLIPTDAKLKTDFDVEDEGVTLERVIRAVEPAKRLRLIIVDACRDNPFSKKMQRTVSVRGINSGLAKVEPAATDTLVAFAARAGSVAEDGSGQHSPFSTALARHLPTPGLDIRVAFGRVRDDVLRATGGRQEPFVYGSLGGSTISLVPAKPGPVTIEDGMREIRRDYEFAERVGSHEAWTSFLQMHATGFFADLARAQLAKILASADVPGRAGSGQPRSDTKRPAELSAIAPALPPPAAGQPAAAASRGSACERGSEILSRLRGQHTAADIRRLTGDIACDALQPQIARLLESIAPGDEAPRIPAPTSATPAATVPPFAAIGPVTGPTRPPDVARPSQPCERDERTLARLREAPDLQAIDRFAQALACEPLRPQVQRLRESIAE